MIHTFMVQNLYDNFEHKMEHTSGLIALKSVFAMHVVHDNSNCFFWYALLEEQEE